MKKFFSFLLFTLLFPVFTHAENRLESPLTLSAQEKAYLSEKKEIRMCVDPAWMPFEKIENGKHIGISADFFQIVQSKIGIPVTMVETKTWTESIEYAKARKCDIFSLAMETPERRAYMNFTKPYLSIPLVIATANDKLFISNMTEVEGKKIGISKGYAYTELFKVRYPNIELVEVETIYDGLELVAQGKIFGFIDNLTTLGYQIQKHFLGELKIAGRMNEKWELGIGARNDEPVALGIFEKAIDSIDEKTKQKIINQWISIKYEQGFDYKLFFQIVAVFVLIALIVAYKQFLLSRYNRELKKRVEEEVNKQRKQEQILLQQSKMAAMGEMLENIAHQWRQPINAISLIIGGLKFANDFGKLDDAAINKANDKINMLVGKMSSTINDFTNFFKEDKESKDFFIAHIINEALSITEASLKNHDILVTNSIDPSLEINGYPNELSQVVLNIINNAKDALIDRGVKNASLDISSIVDGDKITIVFEDNAGGIPEEILQRVFEPYFTTKHQSHGTGIGLYMSKIIIEEHMGGKLTARNGDEGAVFSMVFNTGGLMPGV